MYDNNNNTLSYYCKFNVCVIMSSLKKRCYKKFFIL